MTVRITGVGMSRFGRFLDQSLKETAAVAVRQALQDCGVDVADVGLFVSEMQRPGRSPVRR